MDLWHLQLLLFECLVQFGLYQNELDHQEMVISVHHARYARIRNALKEARNKAGLSQVELAKLLFMEQSNLSKIERGERYIDLFFFIDYCKACNVDPSAILRQIDESA